MDACSVHNLCVEVHVVFLHWRCEVRNKERKEIERKKVALQEIITSECLLLKLLCIGKVKKYVETLKRCVSVYRFARSFPILKPVAMATLGGQVVKGFSPEKKIVSTRCGI